MSRERAVNAIRLMREALDIHQDTTLAAEYALIFLVEDQSRQNFGEKMRREQEEDWEENDELVEEMS